MTKHSILDESAIRNALRYEDGKLFWLWRDDIPLAVNKRFAGKEAGSRDNKGYVVVRLNLAIYKAHRIVWCIHNGPIPDGMEVDHINGLKDDNRIENLRLCSGSENLANRPAPSHNTSGQKGVTWDKRRQKWAAEIKFNGRKRYLGRYAEKSDAIAAYRKAAHELHGEFARLS